jgi:hypothetical protein
MGKSEYLEIVLSSHVEMAVAYANAVKKLTKGQIKHLMENPAETMRAECLFSTATSGIMRQLLELDLKKKKGKVDKK